MRIAVLGNSGLGIGVALAAEMACAGHEVAFAAWPGEAEALEPLAAGGRLPLTLSPGSAAAPRGGAAAPAWHGTDVEAAARAAQLVFLDSPQPELARRVAEVAPALARDAVLHVEAHGYWAALRADAALRRAGRGDVTATDAAAPSIAATRDGDTVRVDAARRGLEVAAARRERSAAALAALSPSLPGATAAGSALQTGLEGINLMVHPAIALLNVGAFDRAEAAGLPFAYYAEGGTRHAGVLADALDAERGAVCRAHGVRHRRLPEALAAYYGATGDTAFDAVASCDFYNALTRLPADSWRRWLVVDVPYAILPLVQLAASKGIGAPLHAGLAALFGALFGREFGREAPDIAGFMEKEDVA
jgi:hypothetical protein